MKQIQLSVLLAVVLMLTVTSAALADAGCGDPLDLTTCPNSCPASFDGINYTCTIAVTTLTPPDKKICLGFGVDTNGDGVADSEDLVTCDEAGTSGSWTCLIPKQLNAEIDWDMSAFSSAGASCGGNKTQGPTGSFTTGPTAVSLAGLQAEGGFALPLWLGLTVLAGLLAVLAMGAVLLRQRRI
jgi:hypothetical protein